MAASNSNDTSTFMEEMQRYECLYNKFFQKIIRTEEPKKTPGKRLARNYCRGSCEEA